MDHPLLSLTQEEEEVEEEEEEEEGFLHISPYHRPWRLTCAKLVLEVIKTIAIVFSTYGLVVATRAYTQTTYGEVYVASQPSQCFTSQGPQVAMAIDNLPITDRVRLRAAGAVNLSTPFLCAPFSDGDLVYFVQTHGVTGETSDDVTQPKYKIILFIGLSVSLVCMMGVQALCWRALLREIQGHSFVPVSIHEQQAAEARRRLHQQLDEHVSCCGVSKCCMGGALYSRVYGRFEAMYVKEPLNALQLLGFLTSIAFSTAIIPLLIYDFSQPCVTTVPSHLIFIGTGIALFAQANSLLAFVCYVIFPCYVSQRYQPITRCRRRCHCPSKTNDVLLEEEDVHAVLEDEPQFLTAENEPNIVKRWWENWSIARKRRTHQHQRLAKWRCVARASLLHLFVLGFWFNATLRIAQLVSLARLPEGSWIHVISTWVFTLACAMSAAVVFLWSTRKHVMTYRSQVTHTHTHTHTQHRQ